MLRTSLNILAISLWAGTLLFLPAVMAPAANTHAAATSSAYTADAALAAPARRSTTRSSQTEVSRAADGLFYVTASINDHPIRFLVDTGSNVVLLSPEDARIAAVETDGKATSDLQTANGASTLHWTSLGKVDIAGKSFAHVDAAVSDRDMPVSLMGQSLLSKLGTISLDADRLVLSPGDHAARS